MVAWSRRAFLGSAMRAPRWLPVEEISKFDLVIDLRVAREMQIKVPQELLYRADEVIK